MKAIDYIHTMEMGDMIFIWRQVLKPLVTAAKQWEAEDLIASGGEDVIQYLLAHGWSETQLMKAMKKALKERAGGGDHLHLGSHG